MKQGLKRPIVYLGAGLAVLALALYLSGRNQSFVQCTPEALLDSNVTNTPKSAYAIENNLATIDSTNAASIRELFTLATDYSGEYPGITDIVFSPDGNVLAASNNRFITIWDVNSQQIIATLSGHTAQVLKLDFDGTGNFLISASRDASVRIWDMKSYTEVARIGGFGGAVYDVAYLPDGSRFITASGEPNAVSLWDVLTKSRISSLPYNTFVADTVAINSTGACLVATMYPSYSMGGASIIFADSTNLKSFSVVGTYESGIFSSAFNQNGSYAAFGFFDEVRIWSTTDRLEQIASLQSDASINNVTFTSISNLIVAASVNWVSKENRMVIWNFETEQVLFRSDSQDAVISSVASSYDGILLASGDSDGIVKIWGVKS